MAEYGMGWLGWSEEQLERTTLPAIETAYKGRVAMLQAVFGDGKKSDTGKRKPTPDEIKNRLVKNGSR